ncbi:MAG: hypothetical protein WBE80_11510 [Methylocella sp.]
MTMGRGPIQALAAWDASIAVLHVGRSSSLVDEDEPRRVQTGLPLAPLEHAGIEKGEQLF